MNMFCSIVFPTPLQQEFTYSLPEQILEQFFTYGKTEDLIGCRVLVDFGVQKNVVGVIVDVKKETKCDKEIKIVKNIIDSKPLYSIEQLEFAKKLADKYFVSLGIVLDQFFPFSEKINFEQSIMVSQNFKKINLEFTDENFKFYKNKKMLVFNNIHKKLLFYKKFVFDIINNDKQLIILFPSNIYLTDFWNFLINNNYDEKTLVFIKSKIMLYTGEQLIKERYKVWYLLRNKQINVVLATKIGVFLPFENISNIIIDEADSLGYKNQEAPMYYACDVVEERIKKYKIQINYCFFVPSIEFMFKNRKDVVYIKSENKPVEIRIVKKELKNVVLKNIYKFKQTVVIYPYKGYSRYYVCSVCKQKILVDNMTTDKFLCPRCGSKYFEPYGMGIQKFVQKLDYIDKNLTLEYIDSTLKIKKIEKIIDDFNNEKVDVLVSTPVLFNYIYRINFSNVRSVYFTFLNNLLSSGTYYTYENVYKLINICKILLNSYGVENGEICLEIFKNNEYNKVLLYELEDFYKEEIKLRKELCFPPFCKIVKIIFVNEKEDKLKKICYSISEQIENVFLIKDIIKEKDLFKCEILIKISKKFKNEIKQIKDLIYQNYDIKYDKVYIDYNPVL